MSVIRAAGLGLFMLILAGPVYARQSAVAAREVVNTKSEACSPAAIREAVDRKQVPAVTGCRYDAVSGPLMSQHILPLPTPVYNDAASGVIVTQKPEAGGRAQAGLLLVQVSRGPKPQAAQASSSSLSSSSESSVAVSSAAASSESQASSAQSSASVSAVSASAASSAASSLSISSSAASSSSVPATATGPGLDDVAGLLWSAIAAYPLPAVIAVALAGLLAALGLSRKPPKMGAAPRVRCELTPGPSRLVVKGPLVLGRKGDAQ